MRWAGAAAAAVMFISCTSSSPVAGSSPRASSQPSASPALAASPSPNPSPSSEPSPIPLVFPSPKPLPVGTAVSRQVLAPAKVLPIAHLCSYKLTTTADGNFTPTFCRGGAINVQAWRAYVQIGRNVMSLSRSATLLQVEKAMCRDGKYLHATRPELIYAYQISAAYYGWKFGTAPIAYLDQPYDPNHPLC